MTILLILIFELSREQLHTFRVVRMMALFYAHNTVRIHICKWYEVNISRFDFTPFLYTTEQIIAILLLL
jgi:hypothetical protein